MRWKRRRQAKRRKALKRRMERIGNGLMEFIGLKGIVTVQYRGGYSSTQQE